MSNTKSKFFSVMVVGDNHKELMAKYSMDVEVEPYVKYEYLKADKYLNGAIKALDNIIANADTIGIDANVQESLATRIKNLKKMTPFEYYRELTDGMYYDENGNALSTENQEGHWKTARIGRSLGVHLILATQKPSGVVDSQIWSNSKFKICLRVQDKSDSMEMIKNDLAAELKNVGRFYLQVGYNEYFAMGQAAWAGAQYYPSKEYKRQVDKNLYFIDNVGYIKKSINNAFAKRKVQAEGEEVTSIVKYLTK